jgi:hypothetical protein
MSKTTALRAKDTPDCNAADLDEDQYGSITSLSHLRLVQPSPSEPKPEQKLKPKQEAPQAAPEPGSLGFFRGLVMAVPVSLVLWGAILWEAMIR